MRKPTYIIASATRGSASNYHTHIEAVAKDGVAHFKLVDRIAEYTEASADSVRMLAEDFVKQGLKKANVFISSRGGDPMQATDIAIILKEQFDSVSITTGAIAASAVTRIMVEFDDVNGYPNSQYMIHRPKMGTYGDENEIESNLKVLRNTTTDYRQAYAKKFGKTEDEVEEMWGKGDYWMNATEAKKLGLISNILPERQKLTAEDVAVLEACAAPTIPAIPKNDKSKTEMDINAMRSALGLDANATEEQVLAAAKSAKEKAAKADQLEADATKNAKARAEALVDKAIAEKKISAEKKDSFVALATADYENAKTALEALGPVPKLSAELQGKKTDKDEKRDDWDLDAWLEKDPEGLNAMAEEDPEKFKKLNGLNG